MYACQAPFRAASGAKDYKSSPSVVRNPILQPADENQLVRRATELSRVRSKANAIIPVSLLAGLIRERAPTPLPPGPPTTEREPSLDQPRAQPGFAELRLRRLAMSSHLAPVATPPVGFYQRGLEKAQAVMDQALADSTRDRQDAAAAELQSWLSAAGAGTTLLDASPEDLLVYLEEWWLPNHP
ncbi:hypothetical protein Vretifemale_12776, partial [Volvox reticuliferus]